MISCLIGATLTVGQTPFASVNPVEWVVPGVLVALLSAAVVYLVASGDAGGHRGMAALFARAGTSLHRVTGLPGWAAGGIALSEWAILVAGIGFYWDVAWHVDLGRDKALFTPPHVMILVGLIGLGLASLTAIFIATVERADTGWRILGFRVPYSALPIGVLAAFAGAGFPLDDLWHATYGIDVTMWSPTHLMMIGGACMTPFASRLMLSEAGSAALETRWGKVLRRGLMGAMLTALSAFQLEFDLGIPQWQMAYQPVLIALAASIAMVAGRATLGRGGAFSVAISFLVLRGIFAGVLFVGGHSVPHMPLYLGIALVVEVAWALTSHMPQLARAVVIGLAIGTIGLATEWAWSQVFFFHPWTAALLPSMWLAVAMAVFGAIVGMTMGDLLSLRPSRVSPAVFGIAMLGVVALLATPFPRNPAPITGTLQVTPAGDPVVTTDRDGRPDVVQDYQVALTVSPAGAVADADWFEVMTWQGGGRKITRLISDGGGRFHTAAPVHTGGTWKSIVTLGRGDQLAALPISMPGDAAYDVRPIKPANRTADFVLAPRILTAESHGGSPFVSFLGIGGLAGMVIAGVVLLTLAYVAVGGRGGGASRPRPRPRVQPRTVPSAG